MIDKTEIAPVQMTPEERAVRRAKRRTDHIVGGIGCSMALILFFLGFTSLLFALYERNAQVSPTDSFVYLLCSTLVALVTIAFVLVRNVSRSRNKLGALFLPAEAFDPIESGVNASDKSRSLALLLCFIGGQAGVCAHLFYVRRFREAIIYSVLLFVDFLFAISFTVLSFVQQNICLPLFILTVIIALILFVRIFVDFIAICVGTFTDNEHRRLLNW